jgi:hypothetical protein
MLFVSFGTLNTASFINGVTFNWQQSRDLKKENDIRHCGVIL